MDIFNFLTLIGGLCLFLFGMGIMGQALERRAGGELRAVLRKLTTNKWAGLLTGLGITAVIQSSSATTVMVVGFVNSGLMSLRQAINVIMGANIGTTVTAWILSLGGISGNNIFIKLLKPSSFTPVLALVGIIFYMFSKDEKRNDTGTILLGFATLMFGMETMSGAVSGLAQVPEFCRMFVIFSNPLLGVAVGAILTAIIQSSSASVGILQALSLTGQVTYGAAIPIIMGQNIGTCITAIISSVGANKNAKRAAAVHLLFNIIGSIVLVTLFTIVRAVFVPAILNDSASAFGIAICHSIFNIACVTMLFPMSSVLEKIVIRLVPDDKKAEYEELDERLLVTPSIALERCRMLAEKMAKISCDALYCAIDSLNSYSAENFEKIKHAEKETDHYEDILGTYLVKLSTQAINSSDSAEAAGLLKLIGDFERIADHAVNIVASASELHEKDLSLTASAAEELGTMCDAVKEIASISLNEFITDKPDSNASVESLEQVIDKLKSTLRTNHIKRLQSGKCSIAAGFVWADLLTDLERISDHCSNISATLYDTKYNNMNLHESVRTMRENSNEYREKYDLYSKKYSIEV